MLYFSNSKYAAIGCGFFVNFFNNGAVFHLCLIILELKAESFGKMSLFERTITGVRDTTTSFLYLTLALKLSPPSNIFNVSIADGSAFGSFQSSTRRFTASCNGNPLCLLKFPIWPKFRKKCMKQSKNQFLPAFGADRMNNEFFFGSLLSRTLYTSSRNIRTRSSSCSH